MSLFPLGQQTGEFDLDDAVLFLDLHALHNGGGCEIFLFFDGGGRVNNVPEPAGDPLSPERGVGGQDLIVLRVALDVGGVERIQGAVQP